MQSAKKPRTKPRISGMMPQREMLRYREVLAFLGVSETTFRKKFVGKLNTYAFEGLEYYSAAEATNLIKQHIIIKAD